MRLKRFLLFQGSVYYPSAGMSDFVASFDTEEEAKKHPAYIYGTDEVINPYQWAEVVDSEDPDLEKVDEYFSRQWNEYMEEHHD